VLENALPGTILFPPATYGRSVLGLPLEVWRPREACRLLVFAGIHGEEPETTFALSRALRQLSTPSPHAAVVLAANPDGLIRGTRGNARGVELNRNFPTADWQPTRADRSTLDDPAGRC
jgi:protein MpaA